MRIKGSTLAAGIIVSALTTTLAPSEASAQTGATAPLVERDSAWNTVSTVSMLIGVGSVSLMPRVYYSSPDATVGWKARWHVSALAPIMTMTALTLMVDNPVKNAIQSPRPLCTVDQTLAALPDSGCETFGAPSTHAYASWGAFGAGASIFLVDTFNYSDSELSVPSLIGNVIVPFGAAIMASVARDATGGGQAGHESPGQIAAGALTGAATGAILGLGYSLMQEPDCGYGGYLFCW